VRQSPLPAVRARVDLRDHGPGPALPADRIARPRADRALSGPLRIRAAIVLLAWIALATFPQWSSQWESSRYVAGLIRQILIFAIFASSLNLLVGYAGLPSLGHAAFFGGGAYAAAIVAQRLGTDQLLATLAASIAGAALLALLV